MADEIENAFKRDGFLVEENVLVKGSSGVDHYFPLLLSKEDDDIAVEFSDGSNIEFDIFRLSIKCRDTGIQHAILILNKDITISNKVSKIAIENRIRILKSSSIRDTGRAG